MNVKVKVVQQCETWNISVCSSLLKQKNLVKYIVLKQQYNLRMKRKQKDNVIYF